MFSWPKRKKARTKKVTIHSYYSVQITQSKCNMFPRCHFAAAFVDLVTNSFSIYLVFTEKFIDSPWKHSAKSGPFLMFSICHHHAGRARKQFKLHRLGCHAVPEMKGCCAVQFNLFFRAGKRGKIGRFFLECP